MILHRLRAPRMIQTRMVWCVPFTAEIRSFENKVSIAFSCACAVCWCVPAQANEQVTNSSILLLSSACAVRRMRILRNELNWNLWRCQRASTGHRWIDRPVRPNKVQVQTCVREHHNFWPIIPNMWANQPYRGCVPVYIHTSQSRSPRPCSHHIKIVTKSWFPNHQILSIDKANPKVEWTSVLLSYTMKNYVHIKGTGYPLWQVTHPFWHFQSNISMRILPALSTRRIYPLPFRWVRSAEQGSSGQSFEHARTNYHSI